MASDLETNDVGTSVNKTNPISTNGNGTLHGREMVALPLPCSLATIGRLVSGFGDQTTGQYVSPIIEPREMAKGLKVTFRPLAKNVRPDLRTFAEQLEKKLTENGVNVLPWEKATSPYFYEIAIPLTQKIKRIAARMTHHDIDAVIDVHGRRNWRQRIMRDVMEVAYWIHRKTSGLKKRHRVREILRFVWFAEDHAVKYIRDHVRTQIVSVRPLDKFLADPDAPYKEKLMPGLKLLVESLSQMVIGVSDDRLSLLNMNLSDTVSPRAEIDRFVLKSFIPKLHAPIQPLTRGRFKIGSFNPRENDKTQKVVELGKRISPLELLPEAVAFTKLVKRPSTRDVVDDLVDGRSGVSFGFVTYMEPPVYHGPVEVPEKEWQAMAPLRELSPDEVRKNDQGRWYLKTISQGETVYRQVPDIWIVSSRSGAEKNDLNVDRDLVRLGFNGDLQLQVPSGHDWGKSDIRPSYDTYVMVALALGTAIYFPRLVEGGAPMIHFHGYPHTTWFQDREAFAGANNPSVACGTFEAGVLNFAGLWQLAESCPDLKLACVIEPDHGCNMVAADADYLLRRIEQGVNSGQIVLGGKHLKSLKEV